MEITLYQIMDVKNYIRLDKRFFIIVAFSLLLISSFLHFWKISEIPNGFFVDESLIGYNAWSALETGGDESGYEYPMFFNHTKSYIFTSPDPVVIYFLAPMVKVFGLEKWVVRFPCAFFLLLSSAAFYFLAKKYVGNRWLCLAGAFVYSILPWSFPLSRIGIGGHMHLLFGIVAGTYFLIDAIGRKSKISAILAGLLYSFAMYSQNPGRPIVASMVLCFIFALNVLLLRRWKVFAIFIMTYVLCLLPMIYIAFSNPKSMTSRFSSISAWSDNCGFLESISRIICRYIEYFNPVFLFVSGDSLLRHHTGESGELYIFMIPLVIAGLYRLFKGFKTNCYCRFAVLALAFYPLSAALTISHMHSTRSINGAVIWSITAILGAELIWHKRKVKMIRIIFYSLLFFSVFEISSYLSNYFGKYVEKSRSDFAAPLIEAFEYSFANLNPGDTLYVSASAIPQRINTQFKPFWYSPLLFFGKVPPLVYKDEGIPTDYICAYKGQAPRDGILIRCNVVSGKEEDGTPCLLINNEAIPDKNKMIFQIPVIPGEKRLIEVYRVYADSGKCSL